LALVVRYPSTGWVLYDLRARAAIIHNGHRVRRCNLAPGDWLQWGGLEFTVEANDEPEPDGLISVDHQLEGNGTAPEPPRCRLIFQTGKLTQTQSKNGAEFVIGCSARCDIPVERAFGLTQRHCLLALESGRWYLHDLSGKGICRDNQQFRWLLLQDGDIVQLGKTSVRFGFDLAEAEAWPGSSFNPEPAATVDGTVAAGSWLNEGAATRGAAAAAVSLPESACAPASAREVDEVYQAGRKLSDWLRKAHKGERRPVPARKKIVLTYRSWLARKRLGDQEPLEALELLKEGLWGDPWNRELLLALARLFDQLDQLNLCLETLETLHDLYPEDVVVNRALAKLCRHLKLSVRAVSVDPAPSA